MANNVRQNDKERNERNEKYTRVRARGQPRVSEWREPNNGCQQNFQNEMIIIYYSGTVKIQYSLISINKSS